MFLFSSFVSLRPVLCVQSVAIVSGLFILDCSFRFVLMPAIACEFNAYTVTSVYIVEVHSLKHQRVLGM